MNTILFVCSVRVCCTCHAILQFNNKLLLPSMIWTLSSTYHPDVNVTITIQYSPPAGVTLIPPNYRAATSVSLRCDAVGTIGSVSYQWSSTCRSSCFVSGSSQTVSRDKLWSYDAGQHTCTVTDEDGNTARATTEMNIIGNYLFAFPLIISHYYRE